MEIKKDSNDKDKPNKILAEQVKKNFNFDFLPNAKQLANNFLKGLSQLMDISEKPNDVLVGVGKMSDLDFDSLESSNLNVWGDYDDAIEEHEKECEVCQKDEYCKKREKISEYIENDYEIYTDGDFVKGDDGQYDIKNDNFTIQINYGRYTFQILKSPLIVKRGFCSLCYPNQCDLDNLDGDNDCYGLPDDYRRLD